MSEFYNPFVPNRCPMNLRPGVVYRSEDGLAWLLIGKAMLPACNMLRCCFVGVSADGYPDDDGIVYESFAPDEALTLVYLYIGDEFGTPLAR